MDKEYIRQEVKKLYPTFELWVNKQKGYHTTGTSEEGISLWYEFMEVLEGLAENIKRKRRKGK